MMLRCGVVVNDTVKVSGCEGTFACGGNGTCAFATVKCSLD